MGRALKPILLAVVTAYIGLGVFWTFRHLGDVPHYGDTSTYLQFAEDGRTSEQRGFLYPWLLALSTRFFVAEEIPPLRRHDDARAVCTAPRGFIWTQVFQIAVGAIAIFFFLALATPIQAGESRSSRQFGILLAGLLLLLDPLISHYNMALMTDGLALSGCLIFCASLMGLADPRRPAWLLLLTLAIGFFLAAGLRVEKKWLLAATFAATAFVWLRTGFTLRLGRRIAAAGLVVAATFAVVVATQSAFSRESNTLRSLEAFVHFRIGFPHLSELYDQLPARTRALISREDAARYDEHVNGVRQVVTGASGLCPRSNREPCEHAADKIIREQLADDVLATVLPRRWGTILLDGVRDALENVISTPIFYLRLAARSIVGNKVIQPWFFSSASNYGQIIYHHRKITDLFLLCAGLVLVLGMVVLAKTIYRSRPDRRDWILWTPAIAFWIFNALFFAAIFNYVNFRYVLFSHILFLIVAYRPLVGLISKPDR